MNGSSARPSRSSEPTPHGAPKPRRELSDLQFALVVTVPVLLFLVVVVAYPLGYALYMSFHDIRFFGGYSAEFIGGENYAGVLSDSAFWGALWLTIRFTIVTVLLGLLIGLGLAIVLRDLPPGWKWLRALIILPWAVSPYGTGIFFAYLGRGQTGFGTAFANALGIDEAINFISAQWVIEYLAFGNAWNMAPLVAFFLLANMLTIPKRLYHLAALDRMNRFEQFWNVTLPPLRFTLFVFSCILTVLALKTFDFIFTQTQGGPGNASSVLTYLIYRISFVNLNLGYGAAMSFFLLALILGLTGALFFFWGRKVSR
ncbi:carbohydrate ABC transporter permease [Pelagibacterium montanilacus]|uniref:carbohydrate ABC transporter permease n=1 Tax=Pelagibacterium montanilacus TaxID=2185280 RepID=UPI000F8D18A6|nr:sugar ABC transporter permease [Pelagibacterium montanilacus]